MRQLSVLGFYEDEIEDICLVCGKERTYGSIAHLYTHGLGRIEVIPDKIGNQQLVIESKVRVLR